MKLRKNKWRRIFFNVSIILGLVVVLASAFPGMTYHAVLFFLYNDSVERVNPDAALTTNYLTLDTRRPEEFRVSHLKNAQWVGFSEFDLQDVNHLPKDTAILVYCSVGYRSEKVGEQLLETGFTNVKNLYGGIFEWKNDGFPVYRNETETDSIHTFGKGWGFFLRRGVGTLN